MSSFQLSFPDFHRIVLDPAQFWENLLELLLSLRFGFSIGIKNDRPRASGSLIEREDEF